MTQLTLQLYDQLGRRKYLTSKERKRFLKVVETLPAERKIFCQVLLYTGCRISEALQLTRERIDAQENVVVFKTLKRRRDHQRAVPVPASLIRDVLEVTGKTKGLVWTFSRRTGWKIIKDMMSLAKIEGAHACPKGLRHGFGISCAENNVPISLIASWLGHASIQTTVIYLNAVGKEERLFANRTWIFT